MDPGANRPREPTRPPPRPSPMWEILRRAGREERVLLSLVGAGAGAGPALVAGGLLLDTGAAVALTVVVAAAVGYGSAFALLSLSRALGLLALAGYAAAAAVLLPAQIDRHESWVDTPNPRQACHGWEFSHYPAGETDATTTDYCIGWESPLRDG